MRKERTSGGEVKVWLTDTEIDGPRRDVGSRHDGLIIQFGAYVGLTPGGVRATVSGPPRPPPTEPTKRITSTCRSTTPDDGSPSFSSSTRR
jgi:hypothetical protein